MNYSVHLAVTCHFLCLMLHLQQHQEGECYKCGNIFGTMIEVHAHVSAAHAEMMEVNGKNHEECNCNLCGAVFKTGKNILQVRFY